MRIVDRYAKATKRFFSNESCCVKPPDSGHTLIDFAKEKTERENNPVMCCGGLSKKSNVQKKVQNWQLCIICQLSKSQTAGLWMRLKIFIC